MIINQFPVDVYTLGRGRSVKYIMIHFTSLKWVKGFENDKYNLQANLDLFRVQGKKDSFSAHFMIGRKGEIHQMVKIEDTAYHAGKGIVQFDVLCESMNSESIGIELLGCETESFTSDQYVSLAELCAQLEEDVINNKLGFIEQYLGHSWYSGTLAVKLNLRTEATKKVDPGPKFQWPIFLREKYRIQLYNEQRAQFKAELKNEILSELTKGEILKLLIRKPK